MYLDREGQLLPPNAGRCASYRVEVDARGTRTLYARGRGWRLVYSGDEWGMLRYLAPEQHVAQEVFSLMRPIKGFTVDHVASYLYMVLRRNGACRRSHIIHTRLLTKDGRPIYILYLGDLTRNYTLRAAYVVSSIQQARSIYPELRMQTLPLPLQWSKDTSDYMWNPYRPTLGILWDTYIHITEDRRDRLHESLQKLPAIELRSLLRRAVDEGRERAQLDSAYALPNYSSRYNTVNLMLPLRLAPTDDEPPENVLMLTKRAHGYALLTVLTVEQAYLGVCAFRDPETTWLRGAL